MSGFAWVTLATNDSYSLGALVLAHSLRQVGTAHQLAVLVTPGVTSAMRQKLSAVFNVVEEVNILDSKDEANLRLLKRPELGITFTKLHCWRLTQFEKCVFLDADTLVLVNSDELFDREEFSAAPDVGWPDCFNSGVFVYRPSNETYGKLVEFAVQRGSFDGGDQGLLNLYFSDWAHKDISKHLPFIYNMCSTACYSYLPAFKQFGADVKIVHFVGPAKPWLQYFDTETRQVQASPGLQHLQGILQRWWDIFCSLIHPILTPDMSGLAGAFAQFTLGVKRTPSQDALENHLRRQAWEVGNIDYLGRDSFDNIWSKICETLATVPPQQKPREQTSTDDTTQDKPSVSVPTVQQTSEPIAPKPEEPPSKEEPQEIKAEVERPQVEESPKSEITPAATAQEPPKTEEKTLVETDVSKEIPVTSDVPKELPKTEEIPVEVAKPEVQTEAKVEVQTEIPTETKPTSGVEPEAKPEVQTEIKSEIPIEAKPELPEPISGVQTEAKVEVQTEIKSEIPTEAKPEEVKTEVTPAQSELKPEVQIETKPIQPESKPEIKPIQPESKPEDQAEIKPIQLESKPEVQIETKPIQPEIKSEVQEEVKQVQAESEPIKSETKPEVQEQSAATETTKPDILQKEELPKAEVLQETPKESVKAVEQQVEPQKTETAQETTPSAPEPQQELPKGEIKLEKVEEAVKPAEPVEEIPKEIAQEEEAKASVKEEAKADAPAEGSKGKKVSKEGKEKKSKKAPKTEDPPEEATPSELETASTTASTETPTPPPRKTTTGVKKVKAKKP